MPAAGVVLAAHGRRDRARPRLLPRLHDRRPAADHERASTRRSRSVVEIIEKSAPVEEVVGTINQQPRRGRRPARGPARQEGRACGTPSASSTASTPAPPRPGFRNFPESTEIKAPRISEVYTKGTLTLARLGREAPIAAASPTGGAVLRNVTGGSLAARSLYPEVRQTRPERLDRSPVIGTDAPVQYEPSDSPGVARAARRLDDPRPPPSRSATTRRRARCRPRPV